jgi:hypothetical protein
MAVHADGDAQDTLVKWPPGLGVAWIVQRMPSQRSARVTQPFTVSV